MSTYRSSQTVLINKAIKLALFGLLLALPACGQRGALVPPSTQTSIKTDNREAGIPDSERDQENTTTKTKAPHETFILDPLL